MKPDVTKQECYDQLKRMLRDQPLLKSLSDEQITEFAKQATYEEHKQGTVILKQGDPSIDFYFILEGQVRVVDTSKDPPQLVNYLYANHFFGERSLLFNRPRAATVDVAVDVLVAKFDKRTWTWLTSHIPPIKKEFVELEEHYEEHASIPFPGRHSDEVVIIRTRRHILAFITTLWGPVGLALTGILSGWLLSDLELFTFTADLSFTLFVVFLSLIWTIYNYVEWYNDDFIVSTKRIIHIERTIVAGEHREEVPLTQVHDVEVNTPNFFTRSFGYSNVIIKPAGASNVVFDGVPQGDTIKGLIFEHMEQAKKRVQAADIASIRTSLGERMNWQGGPLEVKPLPVVETQPINKRRSIKLPRLLRYYIPIVRETGKDSITWRKHHLIWLKSIWLPALISPISFFMIIAAWVGLEPFPETYLAAVPWLIGFWLFTLLWYTYQHDDWHKDIYKVTNTQIIHQDSTAFRLRGEEIKETTFESIQNVNYESPNFFSRVLNMGNVVISTASVGENFVFENVYFPRDVQQEIFKRWVRFKESKRREERSHEESRFTTWLGEYHKLLSEQIED